MPIISVQVTRHHYICFVINIDSKLISFENLFIPFQSILITPSKLQELGPQGLKNYTLLNFYIMKKLMIIILTAGLFFTGCAKVDITPDANKASALEARQLLPVNGYYTITNTETDWGVVEYRIQFTGCDGKYRDLPLLMQESITVCLQNGQVQTNFTHIIVRVKQ